MFLLRIFYYGEGYWEDCDLHVPSCVSAPAWWLPGVDTLLFSPSLRREAGHPGRSGDRAAGVPAKRLVSAAACVAVDLRVWPLASPGRPRPSCAWCAQRVTLADAYTLGAGDLRVLPRAVKPETKPWHCPAWGLSVPTVAGTRCPRDSQFDVT